MPDRRDFVIADTVNQLVPVGGSMSSHFLLGLLSSRVVNWYVYKFLLSEAIRTIHLDRVITNRIPVNIKRMDDVERCVKALLKRGGKGDVAALYDELDCMFYDIFGLSEAEIGMIKAADWEWGVTGQACGRLSMSLTRANLRCLWVA